MEEIVAKADGLKAKSLKYTIVDVIVLYRTASEGCSAFLKRVNTSRG